MSDADFKERKGRFREYTDFGEFKEWLGRQAKALEEINRKAISEEDLLAAILKAFQMDVIEEVAISSA
jgi:hypothetical protein